MGAVRTVEWVGGKMVFDEGSGTSRPTYNLMCLLCTPTSKFKEASTERRRSWSNSDRATDLIDRGLPASSLQAMQKADHSTNVYPTVAIRPRSFLPEMAALESNLAKLQDLETIRDEI